MGAALAATCSSCPVHTPPLPAINPTQTPSVSHLLVCQSDARCVQVRYIMYILVYVPCPCGFKFLHDCIAFFSVGVMSPYAILQRNQYLSVIRYIPSFFCLVYCYLLLPLRCCCRRCGGCYSDVHVRAASWQLQLLCDCLVAHRHA